jgi:hypothetical protein
MGTSRNHFQAFRKRISGLTIQDPMGVSGYVSACSTDSQKKDALSKLWSAKIRADKARDAAVRTQIKEAFDWWRLLYNYKFPTYYY